MKSLSKFHQTRKQKILISFEFIIVLCKSPWYFSLQEKYQPKAQIIKTQDNSMQLQNGHLLPTGKGKVGEKGKSTQVQGNKHIFSPIHHV